MVVQPYTVETTCFGGPGAVADVSPLRTEAVEEHIDVHVRP
jgi:hypothetical protein